MWRKYAWFASVLAQSLAVSCSPLFHSSGWKILSGWTYFIIIAGPLRGWSWSGFSILVRRSVGRSVRWTHVTQTAIYVELTWLLRSRACALSHLVEKSFLSEHKTNFWALHCTVLASRKWMYILLCSLYGQLIPLSTDLLREQSLHSLQQFRLSHSLG